MSTDAGCHDEPVAGSSDPSPYTIHNDPTRADFDAVARLLHGTYWAAHRPRADIDASFRSPASIPFFAADPAGRTVACARVVTDGLTIAWVCDVVVDANCRGSGLGKQLVAAIVAHPVMNRPGVRMMLGTKDAHGLYEQFGFFRRELMWRHPGGATEAPGF